MERKQFTVTIAAPREKIWAVLWNYNTYRQWTSAFAPTSHAVTDWKKGSKALFLNAKGSGMVSRIEENKPYEYMSIEHLGEVKDGVEDTTSDRVKQWAGAHENYTLKNVEGKTELIVDMDLNDEFAAMFDSIWPKALAKVKELSEQQ
jgi:hypothetical protein